MPAEWMPHECCWMAWPCPQEYWGDAVESARRAYARVARTIARFEPVRMLANPAELAVARRLCGADVQVLPTALDDSWLRDTGPTFVLDDSGRLAGVDWQYNSYGNKEGFAAVAFRHDVTVAKRMLEQLGVRRFAAPLVLEGGAFHVDGEGTVLTSEQCLLNPNRNPGLSRQQIEAYLLEYLGAEKLIWLGQGLKDDDTDGHVDNLACFVRPGTVMALTCNDPADDNYAVLQENLARLHAARDAAGRRLKVIEVEQPDKRMYNGIRLAMSYVNFYIANGAVIMPSFNQPQRDASAARVVAGAFPDRELVQVPGLDIIVGGGSVHCITQQQPRPRS